MKRLKVTDYAALNENSTTPDSIDLNQCIVTNIFDATAGQHILCFWCHLVKFL